MCFAHGFQRKEVPMEYMCGFSADNDVHQVNPDCSQMYRDCCFFFLDVWRHFHFGKPSVKISTNMLFFPWPCLLAITRSKSHYFKWKWCRTSGKIKKHQSHYIRSGHRVSTKASKSAAIKVVIIVWELRVVHDDVNIPVWAIPWKRKLITKQHAPQHSLHSRDRNQSVLQGL